MLTVNYKSHVLFSYLKLALENHKLSNKLCETECKSLRSLRAFYSITQRFAVT